MAIATINPATGETIRTFEELSDQQLEEKLALADAAFRRHRKTKFAERATRMRAAAEQLVSQRDRLAKLMVLEMGKSLSSARAEVEKCAWACRYYAENAERFLQDEAIDLGKGRAFVRHVPIGPVLAVMPWNFPLWQVFRFVAPALMAGNVGLLKHASNVPQCALAIEEVLLAAGFERGVFQTLLIGSGKVKKVLDDPRVVAATLTGSEGAGAKVAEQCGREIKKTVLELGGSDPFLVMPSADIAAAAKVAVTARNLNNGQSCIAAKRFIVHNRVYDEFVRGFVEGLKALKVGDPMKEETDIGPLATSEIREGIEAQVKDAVAKGAKVLFGGKRLDGPGYYYQPTALAEIPKEAQAYRDEVFGPVALIFKVRDLDEALAMANDSSFGLGSSVWTRDETEIERCATELEAGMTFFNAMVASDPRLPFGGVKRSGYGRELGRDGILEFVNRKTISVQEPEAPQRGGTE